MTVYSFQSDYEVDDYYNDYDCYNSSNDDREDLRNEPSFSEFVFGDDESQSSQNVLTDEYSWRIIKEINDSRQHVAETLRKETVENLRNQHNTIKVKVDGVVHHLNRIQLALKSDYFEKLLTGNFNEKESELVEIHSIDGHVFPCIIELLNGKKLESVINTDNYVELFMAMDYLQMEIDLKTFRNVIIDNLKVPLKQNSSIFVLHDFVALQDKKFEYLLRVVRGYLSIHLNELYDCPEYLSLSADQLVKIITRNKFPEYTREKNQIGRICAKWICHDIKDRFSHIVDLANAARYRYDVHYKVHLENVNFPFTLSGCKAERKLSLVAKHFNRLLNLDGEIDSALETYEEHESENTTDHIINKMDEKKKWTEFLGNEYLCDVTIKAGGKIFKLHRFVLASSSDYFARIFSAEISKAVQSGNPSNFLVEKDTEYLLEEIDPVTFDVLIKFLYFGEISWSSCSNLEIVRLFTAAISLEISEVIADIKSHISEFLENFHENIIELMNVTYGHEFHEEFYNTLCEHIITIWPQIVNTPQFYSISFDVLENILISEDLVVGEQELLDICSKWIAHDAKNRFSFLVDISVAINRNYMVDHETFEMKIPKDWNSCSQQFIRDRLWEILRTNTLIPSKTDIENGESIGKPMFVATKLKTLLILDANLEKIASIRSPKCPFVLDAPYFDDKPDVMELIVNKLKISATLIDNNLFIVYVTENKSVFQVYNLSSKKLIALASDQRMQLNRKITLLNCNGQVYGCFEDGLILRYVVELNRWTMFSEGRLNGSIKLVFASNGNTLFKVPRLKDVNVYIPEAYDFERNSWISLPALPTELSSSLCHRTSATTVDGNLAILFLEAILLFDNQSQLWRRISIPPVNTYRFEIFTQYEEGVLFTRDWDIRYISQSTYQIRYLEPF